MSRGDRAVAAVILAVLVALTSTRASAQAAPAPVPRFELGTSGLELHRPTRYGAFLDVVGRRSALFGYENRGLEAWAWPLKLLDSFDLS